MNAARCLHTFSCPRACTHEQVLTRLTVSGLFKPALWIAPFHQTDSVPWSLMVVSCVVCCVLCVVCCVLCIVYCVLRIVCVVCCVLCVVCCVCVCPGHCTPAPYWGGRTPGSQTPGVPATPSPRTRKTLHHRGLKSGHSRPNGRSAKNAAKCGKIPLSDVIRKLIEIMSSFPCANCAGTSPKVDHRIRVHLHVEKHQKIIPKASVADARTARYC